VLALLLLPAAGLAGCPTPVDSGETGNVDCNEVSTARLKSQHAATLPSLDGDASDTAWDCLVTLEVPVLADAVYTPADAPEEPSYPGLMDSTVTLRSVYSDTALYILVQWDDPTLSLARFPWVKAVDGTWSQMVNKDSTGHENTWYEDKFAVQWDISAAEFSQSGCSATCHKVEDETSEMYPGKKYTEYPGELTDMWHWKSVRTEPNGQLDDKHVIYSDPNDPEDPKHYGRQGDAKESGGYTDNNHAKYGADCASDPDGTLSVPCFMGPDGATMVVGDTYWILEDEKQPFIDTFDVGDEVAGMITGPFIGSRGDVTTASAWKDGVWTLEIMRDLTTAAGESEDVQFDDLTVLYPFGVGVFDNTQINHAVHDGVLKLEFVD